MPSSKGMCLDSSHSFIFGIFQFVVGILSFLPEWYGALFGKETKCLKEEVT
jgi:hypothetical protein